MNPTVSTIIITALVIVAIGIVLNIGNPIISKSQTSAQIREAEEIMKHLDNYIKEIASEGNGSSRIFSFTASGGSFMADAREDSIQFKINGPRTMEYLSRKKHGDLYTISGNDVDCSTTSNSLIMSNSRLNITFQRKGSSSNWVAINTSQNILNITQRDLGITVNFTNTSVMINGDSTTSNGTGYSEILRTGDNMPFCIAHFHINSSIEYDIYYTLFAGADFLVQEVRDSLTAKTVTTNLAFHIGNDDMINVNKTSFVSKNWYFSNLTKRRNITITNNNGTQSLTNYQMNLSIPYDSDMQSDFDDLRFTYYNSTLQEQTPIDYWIENYTATAANVWLNITYVPAGGQSTLYMYYGNSSISNLSNGTNTFIFWDDFEANRGWSFATTNAEISGSYTTDEYNSATSSYRITIPMGGSNSANDYGELNKIIPLSSLDKIKISVYSKGNNSGGIWDDVYMRVLINDTLVSNTQIPSGDAVVPWDERTGNYTPTGNSIKIRLQLFFYNETTNRAERNVWWDDIKIFKYVVPEPTYQISNDEENYVLKETFTPSKKYITSQNGNLVVGLVFAGSHFYNISLDANYSSTDYLFQLRQSARDNKVLIPLTNGTWNNIDDKIMEVDQDKLIGTTFGDFSVSQPNSVWTYLALIYDDINLTKNIRWGAGSHEIFIKNTGKVNDKTKIEMNITE